MKDLINTAWQNYEQYTQSSFLVQPSIPILFFGDSNGFLQSSLKVITVGLNPSRQEFPRTDPYMRFRDAQTIYPGILSGLGYDSYLSSLNNYFRCAPYSSWFNAFEPLLNGLECSYYDNFSNTAIHTDLCSPLVTDPTWSKLDPECHNQLAASGINIWHRLLEIIQPDIILISVAEKLLNHIRFKLLEDWWTIHTIQRKNPYSVRSRKIQISSHKSAYLVFGRAAQKPFGHISNNDKRLVGAIIREQLTGLLNQ